jgi:hypothetical protein
LKELKPDLERFTIVLRPNMEICCGEDSHPYNYKYAGKDF